MDINDLRKRQEATKIYVENNKGYKMEIVRQIIKPYMPTPLERLLLWLGVVQVEQLGELFSKVFILDAPFTRTRKYLIVHFAVLNGIKDFCILDNFFLTSTSGRYTQGVRNIMRKRFYFFFNEDIISRRSMAYSYDVRRELKYNLNGVPSAEKSSILFHMDPYYRE